MNDSNLVMVETLLKEKVNKDCTSSYFSQKANTYLDGATPVIAAVNDHANNTAKGFIGIADLSITNANYENALHR